MIDIVIPDGNEKAFMNMASRLGYESLLFLYKKPPEAVPKNSKIAILGDKRLKGYPLFYQGEKTRWAFEKLKPDAVFELENSKKKDRLNYRASGLDQVLCRLAKKNNILIGFSVHEILTGNKWILGRIMQNIRLCRKFDVGCFFASFARTPYEMRSMHDMKALALVLGMDIPEMKKSFEVIKRFIYQ